MRRLPGSWRPPGRMTALRAVWVPLWIRHALAMPCTFSTPRVARLKCFRESPMSCHRRRKNFSQLRLKFFSQIVLMKFITGVWTYIVGNIGRLLKEGESCTYHPHPGCISTRASTAHPGYWARQRALREDHHSRAQLRRRTLPRSSEQKESEEGVCMMGEGTPRMTSVGPTGVGRLNLNRGGLSRNCEPPARSLAAAARARVARTLGGGGGASMAMRRARPCTG